MTFEHLSEVLSEVEPLGSRFSAAGWRIYLVGGIVRDQMLGRQLDPDADIDLTTDAEPSEIRKLVSGWADAIWDQGERFGTIGCKFGGRSYELTTHRAEFYEPASRKPDVVFSDDVATDLSRRDFTVNAMAVELPGGDLIDPYDGSGDLASGALRTPLGAGVSFSDDPLRMLRAARFVAGYGLVPSADVIESLTALAPRLEIVAVERRRDELEKLLVLPDPSVGLRLLEQTGVAAFALPGVSQLATVAGRLPRLPNRLPLRLAGLLADDPAAVGQRLEELRVSNDLTRVVEQIVAGAVTAPSVDPTSAADVRRFGRSAGDSAADALLLAAATGASVGQLEARWKVLDKAEDLARMQAPLDGRQVMEVLGVEPGPTVGAALDHLLELRLEEGPMSVAEATRRLRVWWDAQPRNSSTS